MLHRWVVICAFANGCAHYVKLEPKNVTKLSVITSDGPKDKRMCARGGVVEVAATMKDGKTYYEGTKGIVDEKRFDPALVKLSSSVGTMNDRSWNPPNEAFAMLDKTITITATLVANPSITGEIELEPHWACDPQTAPAGGEGAAGGETGAYAEAGGQGGDGGGGGGGGHAPRTQIAIGYIPYHDKKLVVVTVEPQGWDVQAYVLDPSVKLRVFAGGGGGGGGGAGGGGGDAAGPGQRGGTGGRGGDGGDGGDGGEVTVAYDSASPELQKFVVIDNAAGPGGGAGEGGYGGGAENDSLVGQQGPAGRPGRDGRPGPAVRFSPLGGITQSMTAAAGTKASTVRPPPMEPQPVVAAKPKRGERPGRTQPQTPPARMVPPPSHPVKREDGARQYVGKATLEISMPKHPPQRRNDRMEVTSTRTRKRHFTIELSNGCAIAFHRSPGESRHVYDIDGPVTCEEKASKIVIQRGRLELDSERETLSLAYDAKFTVIVGGQPHAGTAHLELKDAARR